jgi:acid stress-induced BolA-like protein IbaG/YrbA
MSVEQLPAEVQSLVEILRRELKGEVEVEAVPGTNRYRLAVVADRFEQMTQLARQDLVWEIADRVLNREQTLLISMILTFAPSDAPQ